MISILIRTSGRPNAFARCLQSIREQTYKDYRIIVACDNGDYVPEGIEMLRPQSKGPGFFWNLYCNELKSMVTDGWYFFLDDDDVLIDPLALERISRYLVGEKNIICQFSRFDKVRPSGIHFSNRIVARGEIGMPCFFIHHTNRDLINFDNRPAADFRYIAHLTKIVNFKWVPEIVVRVFKQGEGKRRDILL